MGNRESLKCDVVIIGGGVSGMVSAILANRKNLSTVLITGNKEVSSNLIESIHPGLLSLLNSLEISVNVSNFSLGSYKSISNGKSEKKLNEKETWIGHHISKKNFLEELKNNVISSDVNVIIDKVINVCKDTLSIDLSKDYQIQANYILDCSGYNRLLTKKLKVPEKFYSNLLVASRGKGGKLKIDLPKNCNAFFLPNKHGWVWLARLYDGSFYWTALTNKNNFKKRVPDIFVSSKLNEFHTSSNVRWRITRPTCSEKYVLCGEAAALIDPASGQGNLQAILSSIQSIKLIDECISKPKSEALNLMLYDSYKLQEFENKTKELLSYYKKLDINVFDI